MKHYTHLFSSIDELNQFLLELSQKYPSIPANSCLVQIYAAAIPLDVEPIAELISETIPDAIIIGASSVGEIADGKTLTNSIVIMISIFEDSRLYAIASVVNDGQEIEKANTIYRSFQPSSSVKAALLLGTPTQINVATFLNQFRKVSGIHKIFGSGAAASRVLPQAWILLNQTFIASGVVLVFLSGENLEIDMKMSVGWVPLGKVMTFTKVDNLAVQTIDEAPAQEVYEHYIGPVNPQEFPVIGALFAFLVKRKGNLIPRTTTRKDQHKSLHFLADVYEGETFHIGVGDPYQMHLETNKVLFELETFQPDALYLFSCGVRRLLMQEMAHIETETFKNLGPCGGFYTYGEIFSDESSTRIYNGTFIAVALKEKSTQPPRHNGTHNTIEPIAVEAFDPYAKQHAKIISRMLNLTRAITDDLEVSNRALSAQAITDKLTQLNNRHELDRILQKEIERAHRYGLPLSVVMVDLDDFKRLNDQFGHLHGDEVLKNVAAILKSNIRSTDEVGRWGGEEFLIIAPQTFVTDAAEIAEKLRLALVEQPLPLSVQQTASFGVSVLHVNDTQQTFLHRADEALYHAKWAGKNQVCISESDVENTHNLRLLQLTWQPKFASGNPLIDRQHQEIFEITNRLIALIVDTENKPLICETLEQLRTAIEQHLHDEEALLTDLNYTEITGHRIVHNEIRMLLDEKIKTYIQGTHSAGVLLEFIVHQLIREHMLETDLSFFPFLTKQMPPYE